VGGLASGFSPRINCDATPSISMATLHLPTTPTTPTSNKKVQLVSV
jgi:hypothetical protein